MQNMHGIFMGTAAECAYGVRSVKCQHLVIYFAQEHMGVGEGGGGACYLNSSPRNYRLKVFIVHQARFGPCLALIYAASPLFG